MQTRTIESIEHTTPEGKLNLTVDLGIPNKDVAVIVQVRPIAESSSMDASGWPAGYFDSVPGSMPELRRVFEGEYEERPALE